MNLVLCKKCSWETWRQGEIGKYLTLTGYRIVQEDISLSLRTDRCTRRLFLALSALPVLCFVFPDEINGRFVSIKIQSNMVEPLNSHAGLNSKREVLQGLSQPGPAAATANAWDAALCLVKG